MTQARQADSWYHTLVRLSRGRLLLRAALLLAGSGWALWWALRARGRATLLQGAERAFQEKLALAYAALAALAVLAAAAAALSARRSRRTLQACRPSGAADTPASRAAVEAAGDEDGAR